MLSSAGGPSKTAADAVQPTDELDDELADLLDELGATPFDRLGPEQQARLELTAIYRAGG